MIQIATREVYRNRWMSVREDDIRHPDGSPGIYGVVDKPTAALIIPVEDGGFHLVEQFRYALSRRSWEFPQGTWPDDRETTTEELARAELAQETGLRAGRPRPGRAGHATEVVPPGRGGAHDADR
jgi:8-oxo-dGTP pyrophosphatase MutT (NUDIX family)